jgi:hypothetical protein
MSLSAPRGFWLVSTIHRICAGMRTERRYARRWLHVRWLRFLPLDARTM